MRKKHGQTKQISPSNLPAVRFDRMGKEREKSNQEMGIPGEISRKYAVLA